MGTFGRLPNFISKLLKTDIEQHRVPIGRFPTCQCLLTDCISYYNLDLPSVCLFHISTAVYGPIGTKLGRKVRDGYGIQLKALVSMTTNLLP